MYFKKKSKLRSRPWAKDARETGQTKYTRGAELSLTLRGKDTAEDTVGQVEKLERGLWD